MQKHMRGSHRWFALLVVNGAVVTLAPVPPAEAGPPAPFTEEAIARGIDYFVNQGTSDGSGVAFADLDNDGDPDLIVIGGNGGLIGVYENDGTGTFLDRSAGNGIPLIIGTSGVVAGDYDGDGDLDLYFSNHIVPNVLARNDGNFQFTDVSVVAGVDDAGPGTGCTWGDYDNDGWIDLYVANRSIPSAKDSHAIPNRLYHNLGNGTFEDVAAALGVDVDVWPSGLTYQAIFFDFDNDADADLYLSTDKGMKNPAHNWLFENVDGSFIDVGFISGAQVQIDSMGVAVGDFDGNLFQDLYCTNTPSGNPLLLNQGNGTFFESSGIAGVEALQLGWGALFFDYDNDGHQDLYVCNMYDPNRLYRNGGSWPCVDVAEALAMDDAGRSFGVATADIDNDGDLDLVVQNDMEKIRLYINHEGEKRRWIKFNIVGQGHNHFAIGAQVRVRVGSVWRLREILAGGNGYKGQNELTVHFGLDDALMVDEVVVTWPGGDTRTLKNFETNRTWRIDAPLGKAVPALSPWSVLVVSLLLLAAGTIVLRQRRVTAAGGTGT